MFESVSKVVAETGHRIGNAGRISLFLDFDGTLVPIEADPRSPRLDESAMDTLQTLADHESVVTTIISGRAIEDLYTRIRLQGLIYAGNHGREIFGRNLRFVEPVAFAHQKKLELFCEDLRTELRTLDGVQVEFKGLTASVHYRQAAESSCLEIEAVVRDAAARTGGTLQVNPGRKVFEISPRTGWHKGAAVQWINRQLGDDPTLTLYLGDDTSDEDAFRVLEDAITIKVGPIPATNARYRLPDPAAVHQFLLWLAIHRPLSRNGS
jgi:trehalose 6-phosphate phosphatase